MDKRVDEYIEKQQFPQKEICQKLTQVIFKTFPNIKEEMKWGVPTYDDGKFYVVALKDHVNLGFSLKGLSKKEIALLKGSGKTMKHIEIHSLEDLYEERIVKLLRLIKNK